MVHHVVADHLGVPAAIYDQGGAVAWSGQLNVFGAARLAASGVDSTICPQRWPGQQEDSETGLHYNRLRYYDPQIGRYISADPIGIEGGLSAHAYVPDPLTWIDLFGLSPCPSATKVLPDGRVIHEPTLPPKLVVQDGQVRVEHYYRSNDHAPAHMHVKGGGPETRIGPNGRPLRGDPMPTAAQQDVIARHVSVIRRGGRKIGRWLWFMDQ